MTPDRRAAIAAYKERKPSARVYALRCVASGEVWVGTALDIDKVFNRQTFSLQSGRHPRAALQRAWTTHGAEAFVFEALELLPEAPSLYARDAALKDRCEDWRTRLVASPL